MSKTQTQNTALLLLGDQLFPLKYIEGIDFNWIFMAEDRGLATHFQYHKHKIIFFFESMRRKALELQSLYPLCYRKLHEEKPNQDYETKLLEFVRRKNIQKIIFFEIEDHFFETRIKDFLSQNKIEWEEVSSPMFFFSRKEFNSFLSQKKNPMMKHFYESVRKKTGILMDEAKPVGGKFSFDSENRKKMPKDMKIPVRRNRIQTDDVHREVTDLVNERFKDHPGKSEDFWLMTDREGALCQLQYFCDDFLSQFGSYQDSISPRDPFLFHSVISPYINVGFLTPMEVIDAVVERFQKGKAPLNSVEGFVRQVMGWREFVRGIYHGFDEQMTNRNFWNHHRKLHSSWYDGETGIPPLDDAIWKAKKYGYNHHIERLMVVSNMMLLSEIEPTEVYRWFMEMFVDSADWVMAANVFGMGQFSEGGIFATKPYICGSNYWLKMSDYKKGKWCDVVDGLYWRFIHKNRSFYEKNPRMGMMTKILDKMDAKRFNVLMASADAFLQTNTCES
ncbi:MAG: cryptochrome/photolyase family protein [Bdellovibrionota bacterium]